MEFFLRLSEEEIVELINSCLEYDSVCNTWSRTDDRAEQAIVFAEEDRKSASGERYALIRGISQANSIAPKYFSTFNVNDFYMSIGQGLPQSYDTVLRTFMAKKFGEEYINALYARHLNEAQAEAQSLMAMIGKDVVFPKR